MNRVRTRRVIVILIFLCFLSRLGQVLNPDLILDGDECVVALMAKHLLTGKELPLFFYGQSYGFAFAEVLAIAAFYTLFGITDICVKLAILSLWTTGVVFFYLALKQLSAKHKWLPLVITLILICTPGWMTWSMKARGGYVTAFMLSNIVMYLLFHEKHGKSKWTYLLAGGLIAIIYESQALWLAGLVPFVIYRLLKEKSVLKTGLLILPVLVMSVAFHYYKLGLMQVYAPSVYMPGKEIVEHISRIPSYVYPAWHGNYEFSLIRRPELWAGIYSYIFSVLVFVLPVIGIYYLRKGRSHVLFMVSVVPVILMLCYTVFTYVVEPRYLLPLIAAILYGLFLFIEKVPAARAVYIPLTGLLIIGLLSIVWFRELVFPETHKKSLLSAIRLLKANKINYTYCTHGMLTWQLNFYSNETIIAEPYETAGRYPPYTAAIKKAGETETVALTGYKNEFPENDSCGIVIDELRICMPKHIISPR